MAPSIWYTRWQPMQHPPVLLSQLESLGRDFQLPQQSPNIVYIAEKGKNTEGGE